MTDADHDVLITLVGAVSDLKASNNEKLADIKSDIKEIKDGTAQKIEKHEERLAKAETQITKIKTWGSAGLLALGILEFIIGKYF